MKAFTAAQATADKNVLDQAKVCANAKAAVDALAVADAAANKLLPLKKAEDAKAAANLVATGTGAADLITLDNTAKALVKTLTDNETAHNTIKGTKLGLQTTAKSNWDAGNTLANTTDETAITDAKKGFKEGKIDILNVATGATEKVKACTAATPGIAKGAEWNLGSHNNTTGAANAAGDVAKHYKDNYLDCDTSTPKGYSKVVTAAKVLSSAASHADASNLYKPWWTAQAALEKQAYIFGKLKHACVAGATYATANSLVMPCLRSGSLEKAYSAAYPGTQGTEDATFPIASSAALVGKLGDFAADGSGYTAAGSISDYVAAATASTAGTAATSLYKARDDAYTAWLAKVQLTADAIVNENRANVEYKKLQTLASAYTAYTAGTTKLGAAGSQALVVENAIQKKQDDLDALGKAADKLANAAAAAAAMSASAMVTLGGQLKDETAAFTKAKGDSVIAAATGLTKKYLEASWNYNKAVTKATQATADKDRAIKAQGLTGAALMQAKTDLTIKTYLYDEQKKKYDAAVATKSAADALKLKYDAAKTLSDAMAVIANKKGKLYEDVLTQATTAQTTAVSAYNTADKAVTTNTADIKAAGLVETTAIDNCKAVDYAKAQAALKKINADKLTDAEKAKKVKTDYDALAKKPASTAAASPEGSDCQFGPVTDGSPKPRPVCADGLCCGAANKYLKDGTKLTVETCQKATAISYTFYPELRAGATVAPATEQWRFSCISGAKNLAATATAALAAAYLMA